MLSQESSSSAKRTQKDRRLSQNLTENSIIDLSNQGSSSHQDDVDGWKKILTAHQSTEEDQLPPLHPKLIAAKSAALKRYIRLLSYQLPGISRMLLDTRVMTYIGLVLRRCPMVVTRDRSHGSQQLPEDYLYFYKIITTIMNAFYTKPSLPDLSFAHEQSEKNYNLNIWGPIIEAMFSNTIVKVKSGDKVLKSFDSSFKIDYRLVVVIN
ncbi:hypothetical protein INT47_000396 [Mucor saturninus]|uniref:Uncharacterized protein n=1 Tax=Mucor saturninus TaxID=64648 RepID=A0A8H7QUU5_9FUNG|nr:hypothetical protein INT47_000396 [Mucor saturninus]